MKHTIKTTALSALMLAVAGPALADQAETKGGIKVKTDDGRFEANINGRIHYDGYLFMNDDDALFGSGLNGNAAAIPSQDGFAFRRTYLTLTGKAYGWKYKFENDFAAGASPASYREMWISAPIHNDGELIFGQLKPRRGLEEVTSSNEITMMERPNTTATGIYSGRQFLMGVGYKGSFMDALMVELDGRELGSAGTGATEGTEYGGRVAWFPMADDGNILHVGVSYSVDNYATTAGSASTASLQPQAVAQYAGRRGPTLNLGKVSGATGSPDGAQKTVALELAGAFGPFTAQAEAAKATLGNAYLANGVAGAFADATVDAYYLQASWFITGERAIYKKDRAALGKPKLPLNSFGAFELAARYEVSENKDEDATNSICAVLGTAANAQGTPSATGVAAADKCKATTTTVGLNWYVNPNVRYMLNYYMGSADLGGTNGKDTPTALSARVQFAF